MSISSINSQNLHRSYERLSSGKRINSAADDAAGLAIAQKLLTQSNGYDVGKRNAATSQDMTKVAEGALGSITDNLQRIRELSIQAANTAVYGDSERGMMQQEIDQLKQSISDTASQTQFNTMNLLDGTMGQSHVASDPDGGGMDINMPDATLAALGVADYDVTGNFDISDIDKALERVNAARADLGVTSNRLDYTMNYNSYASYNTTAAHSRIEDLDYGPAVSEKKKNDVLEQYRIMMQKKREDENGRVVQFLRMNS